MHLRSVWLLRRWLVSGRCTLTDHLGDTRNGFPLEQLLTKFLEPLVERNEVKAGVVTVRHRQ
jgi:hypothetical protein